MKVLLAGPDYEENLSLRYLSSSLLEAGHETVLATFNSAADIETVAAEAEDADLVGVSMCFQSRAREFLNLCQRIKTRNRHKLIVAGGHFASCAAEPLFANHPEIDVIVIHEGEKTLVEITEAISHPEQDFSKIPGIAYRSGQSVKFTAPRRTLDDLDALPFPDRRGPIHFIAGVPTSYLMGSRGCYGNCAYCCITTLHRMAPGKRFRQRSAEQIAEEMAGLYHERGTRQFVFHDDNFLVPSESLNHARLSALEKGLRSRKVEDIALVIKCRPVDANRNVLRRLKDLGLVRVFMGIESATERGLQALDRHQSVEESVRALETCAELDISAQFTLMIFNPDATLDTLRADVAFMRRFAGNPLNFCRAEIYAGTPLEQRMIALRRARGDYLAREYTLLDPVAARACELSLDLFQARCWSNGSLMQNAIGLDHTAAVAKRFYRGSKQVNVCRQAVSWLRSVNVNTVDLLEEVLALSAAYARLDDVALQRALRDLHARELTTREKLTAEATRLRAELDTFRLVRKQSEPVVSRFSLARRAAVAVLALGLPASACQSGVSEMAAPPLKDGKVAAPKPETAQKNLGSIAGTVFDPSGAVVAKVRITLTNLDTKKSQRLKSGNDGKYLSEELVPGRYEIKAELKGFKSLIMKGIVLKSGENLKQDLHLQVGLGCCEYAASPLLSERVGAQSSNTQEPTPKTPTPQDNLGSISGTVIDPTGAVIPHAKIKITNLDTKQVQHLTSDDRGQFTAKDLPAGRYDVKAEVPGFNVLVIPGIVLKAGESLTTKLRVPMSLGVTEYAAPPLAPEPKPFAPPPGVPDAIPAPQGKGSLTGDVTDPQGAVVPNALVTITNTDTHAVRTMTTDNLGHYVVGGLMFGHYTIEVVAQGFSKFEKTGIVLEPGENGRFDLALEIRVDVKLEVKAFPPNDYGCCEYAATPLKTEPEDYSTKKKPFTYYVGEAKDKGTLKGIAELVYGDPAMWVQIFEANRNVVEKPGTVPPGTSLVIPPRKRNVPKLISKLMPAYPAEARRQKVWGDVVMDVALKDDGSVDQVSVIDGPPLLTEAAVSTVKQWRYRPSTSKSNSAQKFVVVLSFTKRGKVR